MFRNEARSVQWARLAEYFEAPDVRSVDNLAERFLSVAEMRESTVRTKH